MIAARCGTLSDPLFIGSHIDTVVGAGIVTVVMAFRDGHNLARKLAA